MYQKTSKRRWTSVLLTGTKLNLWLGLPRKLWCALAALCFSLSPFLSQICLQFLKAAFILWSIFSRFIKNKTFLLGFLISPDKSPFHSFHHAYILLHMFVLPLLKIIQWLITSDRTKIRSPNWDCFIFQILISASFGYVVLHCFSRRKLSLGFSQLQSSL